MKKYNDTLRINEILEKGFSNNNPVSELKLLALYYRDVENLKPKAREEALYEFCKKFYPRINKMKWFDSINIAINYSKNKNKKLIDIDYIPIYKHEMEFIHNLDLELNYRKIILTMLVNIKISKEIALITQNKSYEGYFLSKHLKDKTILRHSNVKIPTIYHTLFFNLEQGGYIETYFTGGTHVKILNDMPQSKSEEILQIQDFENIGLYYEHYLNPKKVRFCTLCGTPFIVSRDNFRRCKTHKFIKKK